MYSEPSHGTEASTVIARGVKIEGDLATGNVTIEGEVHGTIKCTGVLTVGSEAKVNANINAQEAVISGSIEGNIVVIKKIELKSTANINGDIQAEIITVEPGAAMSGRLTVGNKAMTSANKNLPNNKKSGLPADL